MENGSFTHWCYLVAFLVLYFVFVANMGCRRLLSPYLNLHHLCHVDGIWYLPCTRSFKHHCVLYRFKWDNTHYIIRAYMTFARIWRWLLPYCVAETWQRLGYFLAFNGIKNANNRRNILLMNKLRSACMKIPHQISWRLTNMQWTEN